MKYYIDKDSRVPAYMQIYQSIRAEILQGIYQPNKKLPSKRIMALHWGVSVITVVHAYDLLIQEGYIDAQQRSGYRVANLINRSQIVQETKVSHLQTLNKINDNIEYFPFTVLSKTMRSVLKQYQEDIYVKSENQGCNILRKAIADYLRRSRNITVEERQIIIGAGAEYLYSVIAIMLQKYTTIAIEDPSYTMVEKVYTNCSIYCEKLKLLKDGIDRIALQNMKANVLHVTPYHSYPSGITASIAKRREYIRQIQKRNGILIEDDYDSEFTELYTMADTIFSMVYTEGIEGLAVIYINTFSKTIASSMRVGYMVLPISFLQLYQTIFQSYACTVPVFEQLVLAELLNSGSFERHLNRVRRNRKK